MDENAESQAKAEYLQKRIEELQIEWNSLDKRLEVKEVRAESEKVQVERAAIETALKDAQSELDQIQERLIKKDDLDRLIEQLQISKQEYENEVKKLRDEVSDIKQLKADEERLKDELRKLESKTAELTGVKQAKDNELSNLQGKIEDLKGQIEAINKRQEALQDERAEFLAEFETEKATFNNLKNENERLSAQSAVLRQLINDQNGERSGEKPTQDRLAKLKTSPPSVKTFENLPLADFADEKEALENVKNQFLAEGLEYHERVLNAFHTTMKTNETTQMAVLAGISGTGKSQLPRQYAAGIGIWISTDSSPAPLGQPARFDGFLQLY